MATLDGCSSPGSRASPAASAGRGTCLNVGCIPAKIFVLLSNKVSDAEDSAPLGVSADGVRSK